MNDTMSFYQGIAIVKRRGIEPYAKYYRPIAQVDFNSDVDDGRTMENEKILKDMWLEEPVDIDVAKSFAQDLIRQLPRYRNVKL
jgi:hypothetical protein